MVKTGFNLIIALLILRLLTKRCYGKESCDEKVNKIIKKEQINSFENRNQSHVWMDSTMFQNILRWKSKKSSYIVYYKYYRRVEWMKIEPCVNISRSHCDMSAIDPSLCYDIKVEENEKKILGSTNFYPEFETKLLPLDFKASRANDIIFIQPNVNQYKHSKKYLNFIAFQIKYWEKIKDESKHINPIIKTFTFKYNSEVTIVVEKPDVTYCMALRLHNEIFAGYEAESSLWGDAVCLEKVKTDENKAVYGTAIAIGVVSFLLISLIFWCALRKYKKITKDDQILPEYLAAVKQEIEEMNSQNETKSLSRKEEPDPIDGNNCYVTLNPNAYIHPLFVDLGWGVRSNKRKMSIYSDTGDQEIDSLWYEECEEPDDNGGKAANRARRFERARCRSHGYHSFSSDDVVTDDSATLPYEQNEQQLDLDYVNATAAFHKNDQVHSGVSVFSGECDGCKNDDYVWSVEAPMTSRYINMRRNLSTHENPVLPLFRRNESDSVLFLNRHLPCENVTYCSHLYGNIPDALVERSPAEDMG